MATLSEFRFALSSGYQNIYRHSDCHTCDALIAMNKAGQRIRYAREKAGYLNQGEFAKLCGIGQGTLSEIESGETKLPNAKAALIMCELTGVTLRWIIYGDDGEIAVPTKEEQEFLLTLRSLDDKQRIALVEMAKAIAQSKSR